MKHGHDNRAKEMFSNIIILEKKSSYFQEKKIVEVV